ncbi:Hsp20/alpha crystallin family protein [Croceicoccus ponticola]|uniref:Hsp20/alpha crystallin family protein n=1 Tax=Croceicoccus ponticola TaxID=2217664 RepID=A0A437H1T6_9SPHN|nr:Hsp20/alpha crystallin family protein [Croceicoccus ponticola]RVQ69604.1 Hsp20/alpha crystallin family protein [Croceicoccus ponticola]
MNEQATLPVQTAREHNLPAVFGRLRDEIDQLFDEMSFPRTMRSMFRMPSVMEFSPAVELKDRKDHYELAVELPGLEEKDIDVQYADGILSISGEKRAESEEKTGDYLVSERSYGSFRRQLSLPADVDPEGIEAKYRHGVLKIDLKKDKQAVSRVRKIAVS